MPELPGTLKPPRLASAPGSPVLGQMYYDTATSQLKWWNGSSWVVATGTGALPADTVIVAATRIISNKLLAGDAQPAWRVLGDGKMEWGPGGVGTISANLYREPLYGGLATQATFLFSNSFPNVLRSLADQPVFQTWGNWTTDTQPNFSINRDGKQSWGAGGTIDLDVTLYRNAAGYLKTDANFQVAGNLYASTGGAGSIFIQNDAGRVFFGVSSDAFIARVAARQLETNGALRFLETAVGDVVVASYLSGDAVFRWQVAADGKIAWGPGNAAPDANFYRAGVGSLKTDGWLTAGGGIQVDTGGSAVGVYFGASADTNLYRVAASTLKTDTALIIGGNVGFFNTAAQAKQTVTGSRGANAALTSLLTALATYGLIVNSSS